MHAADDSLDVQVTNALAQDPRTARAAIDVACLGGRVTLAGVVGSPGEKAAAVDVARGVPGVVTVDDELQVQPGARRR